VNYLINEEYDEMNQNKELSQQNVPATPIVQSTTFSSQTQTPSSSSPPFIHDLSFPTNATTQTPDNTPKRKKKSNTSTVLLSTLGALLFIIAVVYAYRCYQRQRNTLRQEIRNDSDIEAEVTGDEDDDYHDIDDDNKDEEDYNDGDDDNGIIHNVHPLSDDLYSEYDSFMMRSLDKFGDDILDTDEYKKLYQVYCNNSVQFTKIGQVAQQEVIFGHCRRRVRVLRGRDNN